MNALLSLIGVSHLVAASTLAMGYGQFGAATILWCTGWILLTVIWGVTELKTITLKVSTPELAAAGPVPSQVR